MFWRKRKEERELQHLKRIFGSLVPEPVVSIVFEGLDDSFTDSPVDFVFVLIEHVDAERFHRAASRAIELVIQSRATVVCNCGGVLQIAAGPRIGESDSARHGIALAERLASEIGDSTRIVHGRTSAHIGSVGTKDRKTWGFFPLQMSLILRALLDAPYGQPVNLGELR